MRTAPEPELPTGTDYDWLERALGGPGTGPAMPALARPDRSGAQLVLPLASRAAAVSSLRRNHDARSRRERLVTAGAAALARLGKLHWAPGERTMVGPFAVVDELRERLGEDALAVAYTLGPRRRNRKPVLQLIRLDGTPIGFAKVGWSPFTRELVANEATWLDRIEGRLPRPLEAPRVQEVIEVGHLLVVLTEALRIPSTPRRLHPLPADQLLALGRSLGSDRRPIADLPYFDHWRRDDLLPAATIDRIVECHGDRQVEAGLWHGDLTPWNTSTGPKRTLIWDWEFTDGDRPLGFDLLHVRFELLRRRPDTTETSALSRLRHEADAILAAANQPTDAVFDLYLAELVAREARLRGEGWNPTSLGPLDRVAGDLLARRLS